MTELQVAQLADSFRRASELMDEARRRLEILGSAESAANSAVSETRRVNGGLLQVLSVLNSVADQSLANQAALGSLAAQLDGPRATTDVTAAETMADRVVELVAVRMTRQSSPDRTPGPELLEVLDAVRHPSTPPWLPKLHEVIAGSSTMAIERAVAPLLTSLEFIDGVQASVDGLHSRMAAVEDKIDELGPLVFEQVRAAVFDQMRAHAPDDAVLGRLASIEQAIKLVAAKREALPKVVSEGMTSLLERMDNLIQHKDEATAALAEVIARQAVLERRLAQIDDNLMEIAKDVDDVHAVSRAGQAPYPPVLAKDPAHGQGADVLPQRIKRRLFKT